MSWWRILADLVVVFHAAYVGFVVIGLALILAGLARGWGWVRNFWFRWAHLLAIGIVVGESALGIRCPLTVWEHWLRRRAGDGAVGGDFLESWTHRIVFVNASSRLLTFLYVGFGALVLLAFVLGPPRGPWSRKATGVGVEG